MNTFKELMQPEAPTLYKLVAENVLKELCKLHDNEQHRMVTELADCFGVVTVPSTVKAAQPDERRTPTGRRKMSVKRLNVQNEGIGLVLSHLQHVPIQSERTARQIAQHMQIEKNYNAVRCSLDALVDMECPLLIKRERSEGRCRIVYRRVTCSEKILRAWAEKNGRAL